MVEIAPDGRNVADGTPLLKHPAHVIPHSPGALRPITQIERDAIALTGRVRFDLPIGSFEQLAKTSEVLASLALVLQGLSYQRQRREVLVVGEARQMVKQYKRKLAAIDL